MKRFFAILVAAVMLFGLTSCSLVLSMPYNGHVTFNDISLDVPEDFLRDSTQSKGDAWLFEKGGHDELIILTRTDLDADEEKTISDYYDYMTEKGNETEIVNFLNRNAVHTTYTQDDLFCQEILFVCKDSVYAVAMRGSSTEDFASLIATITA